MPIFAACLLLTLGYVLLMLAYRHGWQKQPEFVVHTGYRPATFISVIIPARNEKENIGKCIDAILAQDYPAALFEIIIVDDHSEDNTAAIVRSYSAQNITCISLADHLSNREIVAYKKAAIAVGIEVSRGTLIVTTDADCIAPAMWLQHIAAIYEQQHALMIVAPVIYSSDKSIVQTFQLIDFMSMQGITAAAHHLKLGNMSNGANLAFSRKAYEEVGGYTNIDHMASGDDLLLMMKINKFAPGRIAYLRSANAIVSTLPQPDWRQFLQQRIRWASKSGKYNDTPLTMILVLVYLFNLSFLVLAAASIWDIQYLLVAGCMLFVKMIAEYLFLIPVAKFFKQRWIFPHFFLLQPLHILYIIVAGFLGFIGDYKWKGRKVK